MDALVVRCPISDPTGQEGVNVGGRTKISIPKIPSPTANHKNTFGLHGRLLKGTTKFHGSESCGTLAVVLIRASFSCTRAGGGGGG